MRTIIGAAIPTAWLVVLTLCYTYPTSELRTLALPLGLGFIAIFTVYFIRIFTDWRTRRWRAALPFTLCVVAYLLAHVLGRAMDHALHASR